MAKARLNYSMSAATAAVLEDYCVTTGRKAADVVRQVILDYLQEGAQPLPASCKEHPSDKRADLWLQPATAEALDARCRSEGHVTRSALIETLVSHFLTARQVPQTVQLTLDVPSDVFNVLARTGNPRGVALQAIIAAVSAAEGIK